MSTRLDLALALLAARRRDRARRDRRRPGLPVAAHSAPGRDARRHASRLLDRGLNFRSRLALASPFRRHPRGGDPGHRCGGGRIRAGAAFASMPYGWIGTLVVAAVLLAGRSLFDHVLAVARAFDTGGLAAGAPRRRADRRARPGEPRRGRRLPRGDRVRRRRISPTASSRRCSGSRSSGCRACSPTRRSTPPTSMIGHLTPRHRDFGWAAARLDDLVNLPASRLAGLPDRACRAAGGGSIGRAFRDHGRGRAASTARPMPAGRRPRWPGRSASRWPARGAIAARWSTTRSSMPADGAQATPADIRRGLRVYARRMGAALRAGRGRGGVAYLISRLVRREPIRRCRAGGRSTTWRSRMVGEPIERRFDRAS